MSNRQTFYSSRITELSQRIFILDRQIRKFSLLRIAAALLIVFCIYAAFAWSLYWFWIALFIAILFFRLINHHMALFAEREIIQNIRSLNEAELQLLQGNKAVIDPGETPANHIYSADLDIFGKGSLFQSINRCGTTGGRSKVVNTLLSPLADKPSILSRGEAITELADDVEWRQRFFAIGYLSGETREDALRLTRWLAEPEFFHGRRHWLLIARVISTVSVLGIVWMVLSQSFYFIYIIGWLTFNTALYQSIAKDATKYFSHFGNRTKLFKKLAELFSHASLRSFQSALGKDLSQAIAHAGLAFRDLSRLANLADQRLNVLVAGVMNGLFLFDLFTINKIEKWRLHHAAHVPAWTDALSQIDMLCSFSNYKFNHPDFCTAEIETGPGIISASQLGHPLLPQDECVRNDYEIGVVDKAHIITGSNMAGKSTFIRAVGLNMVLAMNGLPVCAAKFSCSIMSIASCIRITDSLEDHASYFKAELVRLQEIMLMLKTGTPHLVLLDEIMRGTNSDDKRLGTLAFFKRLKDYNCLSLLATHDLVIGQLAEQYPDTFRNFCFESAVERKELKFDYKLRPGLSTSTNASFLMRNLGLIE